MFEPNLQRLEVSEAEAIKQETSKKHKARSKKSRKGNKTSKKEATRSKKQETRSKKQDAAGAIITKPVRMKYLENPRHYSTLI